MSCKLSRYGAKNVFIFVILIRDMEIDIEHCYKNYAPMVFRRCISILKNEDEALDAAQDVFVSLIRSKKSLHGTYLSSLLYTIATNICLNRLKREKMQSSKEQSVFYGLSSSEAGSFESDSVVGSFESGSIDPQFNRVEDEMLMDAIFRNESETTRTICFMYHRDNMTLKEIGEVMGLSISGVRKKLIAFNARAKIKLEGSFYE